MILEEISGPDDLRGLGTEDLARLCDEIRAYLVQAVSRTGGHLGPNLGVVELTVALHRVFDSPTDTIVFDTGHQAYVHKMLTGRLRGFDRLRQHGGLSGYPSRAESEHDVVENSHASTGISYAVALATARGLTGRRGKTICVIGDGALTGGMAYEALNNIGQLLPELIIVLNDNGRSYAPTVGGIAHNLGQLRLSPRYEAAKDAAGRTLRGLPVVGESAYDTARRMKNSLKQLVAPMSIFETLGIKYGGPIDGHNIREVERALRDAAHIRGPVVVHVVTHKGHGYGPAVDDEIDKFHGVSSFDPTSGSSASQRASSWTDLFGDALCELADGDERVVAITAAMASSTGLLDFAKRFPQRFFDVGIAEQHAVTFASGLAMGGLRPVVCIYSSFLQRAFDQVTCDAALHHLPVIFVLDRAGVTGEDGASHHGSLDLAYLRCIPGMTVAAPSDPTELVAMLAAALAHDGPMAIRFPRGAAPAVERDPSRQPIVLGRSRTVHQGSGDVALIAIGKMVSVASTAAEQLAAAGISASVIDARFAKPIDAGLVEVARQHHAIVTVEDGTLSGGFGSAVSELLADHGVHTPMRRLGLPDRFLEHGAQGVVLTSVGLDPNSVARATAELVEATVARPARAHHQPAGT